METCIVGCKLPHGLNIELAAQPGEEPKRIKLKGANAARIVGGYGLTTLVPKEAFETWLKENATRPFIKNGSVFMETSAARADSVAKERRAERTGLEAIDPADKKDGRGRALSQDSETLRQLREQQAKNPDRNRQVID